MTAKPAVLCVDDEPLVLEGLHDVLRRRFDVRAATSGAEGLEQLRDEPHAFAVVISDMRMPAMGGAEFLRSARLLAPNAVRVLLTGYADLDAAIRAVNAASLFRFLTKPCQAEDLLQACTAALEQHQLQTAERVLLEQTLRGSIDALTEVLALANPTAFGRAGRIKDLVSELADALALEDRWEVEVAAMLADVGAVTLPQTTASKLYAGSPLTAQEAEMARRVPVVTRQLLGKIPRLEGVLEILQRFRYGADVATTGRLSSVPSGARLLRIATDFAALESRGSSATVALGAMRDRAIYDPSFLRTFTEVVGVGPAEIRELSVLELRVEMILADDVRSVRDELLLARGQKVTERLVERLRNLGAERVREPIRVLDARTEPTMP